MYEPVYTPAAALGGHAVGRAAPPGSSRALGIAALCLVGLALTWSVAALVPAAQVKDAVALHDFTLLGTHPHVEAAANFLLNLLDPLLFIIWGLALVLFAIAGGRPRVAAAITVVMGMAPLSAEVLKPLLAHPHVRIGATQIGPASWPSGHATAALALALSAVLVAPARRRRAVIALGAVFTFAVGCALLIRAWHMPSDVVGGYLLAGLWMALAVAGLRAGERRWPTSLTAAPTPPDARP
jgi:membrane-associated phospholipid phosphatase